MVMRFRFKMKIFDDSMSSNPCCISLSFFASHAPRERKVCIAKYPPRYWKGPRAALLAPSDPRARDWRQAYRLDMTSRFADGDQLRSYLLEIALATPRPILCCYERQPEDCHRSVLAGILREKLGWEVHEWHPPQQGVLL